MSLPIIPLKLASGTQLQYECDVRSMQQQKDPGLIENRVSPGLNAVKLTVNVNQIVENGDALEAFLVGQKGIYPFVFGADAPPELVGLAFRCQNYQINKAGDQNGVYYSQMSGTFTQVFRAATL